MTAPALASLGRDDEVALGGEDAKRVLGREIDRA
jgi:hypothetical protein